MVAVRVVEGGRRGDAPAWRRADAVLADGARVELLSADFGGKHGPPSAADVEKRALDLAGARRRRVLRWGKGSQAALADRIKRASLSPDGRIVSAHFDGGLVR